MIHHCRPLAWYRPVHPCAAPYYPARANAPGQPVNPPPQSEQQGSDYVYVSQVGGGSNALDVTPASSYGDATPALFVLFCVILLYWWTFAASR